MVRIGSPACNGTAAGIGSRITSRFGEHERQNPRVFAWPVRQEGVSGFCLSSAPGFVACPVIEATAGDIDPPKRAQTAQLLQ